jgi:hypothetical protein
LFLRLALRVLWAHRQSAERQLAQQFADRALVQLDSKRLRNPQPQIDTAPADYTVPLKLRALLDLFRHFGLLLG